MRNNIMSFIKQQNYLSHPLWILLLTLLTITQSVYAYEDGIRIAWDYRTSKVVNGGVYSRVKKLSNGELAFIYSEGPEVWIRKSRDLGQTWSNRVLVSTQSGYNNTNAELIQLQNGWLLYAWNGRPLQENTVPYTIKTKVSKDLGATWQDEKLIYTADITFANGCWEPSLLQLPSGEVQLFFANENPYRSNANQEITMVRSFDNGSTWTTPVATSYRVGSRDGMPVPVYLKNNKGIVYAIEDPGLNGTFKPVIISTSVQDNWSSGIVYGNSAKRWGALRQDYALPASVYAGAPYLIQLPTGETLLSAQSSEGRISGDNANLQVYIGDENAQNFSRKSTPFPYLGSVGNALWSAMEVIDASTIVATSSVNTGTSANNGLYLIQGKIIRPLSSYMSTISMDGVASNGDEWNTDDVVFMGSYSATNATVRTSYNADFLYLYVDVRDKNLNADSDLPWDDDGIEVYVDPQNKNCNGVCGGMYKFLFNIENKTLHSYGNNSRAWVDWTPSGIQYKFQLDGTVNTNTDTDDGYSVEIAIPWNQIGGKPNLNSGWGIHFKLHDDANGSEAEFHEDLSGNDPNRASTYLRIDLKEGMNGQGLTGNYFKGQQFDTPVFTRLDNQIVFDWGNDAPDPRVPTDQFSVRWSGHILPNYSDLYTFHIKSDNGRRLWIDNTLVIDKWINDWDVDYTGQIQLVAGKVYDIKLEYFENNGGANILFQWESAHQTLQPVPKSQLFPESIITGIGNKNSILPKQIDYMKPYLYPNPVSYQLYINDGNNGSFDMAIYNLEGKPVMKQEGEVSKILVEELPSGHYLLFLNNKQALEFIKQ